MAVNIVFLDPEPLFFHSGSSSLILKRWWGSRWRPTNSENLLVPGIESWISGFVARYSDPETTEAVLGYLSKRKIFLKRYVC
jgi:hypothetical protein